MKEKIKQNQTEKIEAFLNKIYKASTKRELKELRKIEADVNMENLKVVSLCMVACFLFRFVARAYGVMYTNTGYVIVMLIAGISFLGFWYSVGFEALEKTFTKKVIYISFWAALDVLFLQLLSNELVNLESFSNYLIFLILFVSFFTAPIYLSVSMLIITSDLAFFIIRASQMPDYKKTLYAYTLFYITILAIVIVNIKFNEFINEKKAVIALKSVSEMDMLTALLNRRGMEREMDEEWKYLTDTRKHVTAILMDIDHFKSYNDTYGHIEGDKCLKRVCACIYKASKKYTDIVVRYGGEEIVVIIADADKDKSMELAQKIKDSVEELKIKSGENATHDFVTVSIGIGSVIAGNDTSVYNAIDRADKQLYISKMNGRNRITCEAEVEGNITAQKNILNAE